MTDSLEVDSITTAYYFSYLLPVNVEKVLYPLLNASQSFYFLEILRFHLWNNHDFSFQSQLVCHLIDLLLNKHNTGVQFKDLPQTSSQNVVHIVHQLVKFKTFALRQWLSWYGRFDSYHPWILQVHIQTLRGKILLQDQPLDASSSYRFRRSNNGYNLDLFLKIKRSPPYKYLRFGLQSSLPSNIRQFGFPSSWFKAILIT